MEASSNKTLPQVSERKVSEQQLAVERNVETQQWDLLEKHGCDNLALTAFDGEGQVGISRDSGSKVLVRRVLTTNPPSPASAAIDREITVRTSVSDASILLLIESLEFKSVIWTVTEHRSLITVTECIAQYGPMPEDNLKASLNQLFSGIASLFYAGVAPMALNADTVFVDEAGQLVIQALDRCAEFNDERVGEMYGTTTERVGSKDDVYVAPEAVVGEVGQYNARKATIWSCGVLLLFLATGQTDKVSIVGHPSFGNAPVQQSAEESSTPPATPRRKSLISHFRRPSSDAVPNDSPPSSTSHRLSTSTQSSKFTLSLARHNMPNYARWVLPKMIATDPPRRAELIEVCTRIPKEYKDHDARPLVELAWLDYKTHVGPSAGLDLGDGEGSVFGDSKYAESLYSMASAVGNPFRSMMGGSSGRRESAPQGGAYGAKGGVQYSYTNSDGRGW